MKERIFTTKEQGRVLVEAGLPISTAICIENLNASGMLQNHKLAGSVYDASFSMFRNQLEYKCRWYGKELIVIDRFYPSSKTCSRCGWKNKDLKLSDRTFVCKDCGMEIDRDLNAAINIQAVGVDAAIRTQSSRVASCVEASKMEYNILIISMIFYEIYNYLLFQGYGRKRNNQSS